jgi:thymidylate synthase
MEEYKYLDLLNDILNNGSERNDRTCTGTISVFARQLRFNISNGICPVLTTKKVPWKHCIEELLWFLRGDTDSKKLESKGVKIWKGNSSREFLDNRSLNHLQEGDIGAGYGFQWRHYGAEYTGCNDDYNNKGIDQVNMLIQNIKTNPYDRRHILTAWNPSALDQMALPPCHCFAQFYVEGEFLSCHMYQRSVDAFLGFPWNILSYSLLTKIIALKCGLEAKELIISTGDTHIYKNHINQVKEQLSRTPFERFPTILLDNSIKTKDFSEIIIDDFTLCDYNPQEAIKGLMAI